jgi:RND family efflux transporter MFP subunit
VTDKPASELVTSSPPATQAESARPTRHRPFAYLGIAVVAMGLGFGIIAGFRARSTADTALRQSTAAAAVQAVRVVTPTPGAPTQEIRLPGTTQAFTDTPIFARTSGYVKAWYFDIGAHVKRGQLLAEIESPEVDQQLEQARADLQTARANLGQAQITADRWQALLKSDSVSKQETDQAVSALSAARATADSNAANVRRLEQLQGFEKLYAPFDGVITARNVDIGNLVNAGSTTTSGRELFHVAAIHTLRVFVNVPEIYARAARPGSEATITLDEFPGRSFHGKLVRTANAIDLTSRTLLVEVDVDNPTGELLPGAYAFVHLSLPRRQTSLSVPVNTLLFRSEGPQLAVVRDGQAQLVSVTIGRDDGRTIEITSGLQPTDQVIVAPSDSLTSGTPVRIASAPDAPRTPPGGGR